MGLVSSRSWILSCHIVLMSPWQHARHTLPCTIWWFLACSFQHLNCFFFFNYGNQKIIIFLYTYSSEKEIYFIDDECMIWTMGKIWLSKIELLVIKCILLSILYLKFVLTVCSNVCHNWLFEHITVGRNVCPSKIIKCYFLLLKQFNLLVFEVNWIFFIHS